MLTLEVVSVPDPVVRVRSVVTDVLSVGKPSEHGGHGCIYDQLYLSDADCHSTV